MQAQCTHETEHRTSEPPHIMQAQCTHETDQYAVRGSRSAHVTY